MILPRRTLLAALAGTLAPRLGHAGGAAATPAQPSAAPTLALALTAGPSPAGEGRLSYDGSLSGPVVRVRRGTTLDVTLKNGLTVPTTLQWHGLRGASGDADAIEGTATVAPGGSLAQTIRAAESGLVWFHPAARPGAAEPGAGLRGILIVEEDAPPAADLDLLLVIEDSPDGGALRVNGVAAPGQGTLVSGGRLRLRLLNATAGRILLVGVDGAPPKVIAIDGQPSNLFPPLRDTVPLGPGSRFELMADVPQTPGARVAVVVRPPPGGEGPRLPEAPLYVLETAGPPRAPLPPIAALPPNPALPPAIPLERSTRARLTIEAVVGAGTGKPGWNLNGTASAELLPRPLFAVAKGGPVTLSFDNRSTVPVPIRVHGQALRLLHAKDDGWEPYWRDSVILPPGVATLVAFVPDSPGRWLIDSADARQTAAGLRCWFNVTGEGP